jgi:hypothetical protein
MKLSIDINLKENTSEVECIVDGEEDGNQYMAALHNGVDGLLLFMIDVLHKNSLDEHEIAKYMAVEMTTHMSSIASRLKLNDLNNNISIN